jgi:hypothetical protein
MPGDRRGLGVMRGQFDKLANVLARPASRRRVLRGTLVGFIGAVSATVIAGSQLVAAEASISVPSEWSVQQVAGTNQLGPIEIQSAVRASTGLTLNQAAVRLDQTPPDLKQIQERLFQARPGLQQRLSQRTQANASQRPASANRTRRQANQQIAGSGQRSRPSSVQGQRSSEQIRAGHNQTRPRFNQRGLPGLNRAGSH